MSFVSVLKHIGQDILKVFNIGEKAAEVAEPFVDSAFPALAGLYNTTVSAVANAEALGEAAASSGNTSAQKLANVVTAITPTVKSTLVNLGVPESEVTSSVVTNYVNAVVAALNALPAPAASAAPVSAPAPVTEPAAA